MNAEQRDFLALGPERWPARLSVQQAAWILGLEPHHFGPLASARLVTPLGKAAQSAPKYFPTVEILKLRSDSRWLNKASETLSRHWSLKNSRRKTSNSEPRKESLT